MKALGLFLLLFIGFVLLFYYIFLVITGKRLAKLVNSKDRFIWNGLRNITDKSSRGRATMFLDESQLVISSLGLTQIYSKLQQGSLDDGFSIPFTDIAVFDYSFQSKVPFLRRIINQIFKINNYTLKISYFDDLGQIVPLKFKASSLDPLDFEATFADFNNKIYGDHGLRRSTDNEIIPLSQRMGIDDTAPLSPAFNEDPGDKTVLLKEDTPFDREEKTTILPKESFLEEDIRNNDIFEEAENKTTILSKESFLEEDIRNNDIFEETENKTTILAKETFLEEETPRKSEIFEEEKDHDLEKTVFLSGNFLKRKEEKDFPKEDKTVLSPPIVKEEDQVEQKIQRRSFLDRSPRKGPEEGLEDKTISLELPDELKKKENIGMSEEEIKQEELERLKKLKEFFSERNEDQG
ncbi:MAG TPA: hypothetical protein VFD08_00340 [Clostridia bacterium]|nr:hypothetical protein [Clostridia bacterium]